MLKIKTVKSGFKLVPEGTQIVHVDSVTLLPSGRPSMVEFVFSHDNGGFIKDRLSFTHPVAVDILGKRCDIALGGKAEVGTEINPEDLEGLFLGKHFEVVIKHKEGNKGGTFANISYMTKMVSPNELMQDEDQEDDL